MFDIFNIYIKRAAEIYGIPKTRQIYEKAIEVLPEDKTREMCLRFADMETKLGKKRLKPNFFLWKIALNY